jgi:phosphate starvation-inducible PhoH-like protein
MRNKQKKALHNDNNSHYREQSNRRGTKKSRRSQKSSGELIDLKGHFNQSNVHSQQQKKVEIIPRNLRQEDYLAHLENSGKDIIFALGPAGTGKTLLATLWSVKQFLTGEVERIIVTRPAVSVDEQHGFLPGDLMSKMAPWTRPVFDVFRQYWNAKQLEAMIQEGTIEVAPLAYMRGRTFENSVVIADEMQNATPQQMKMLLTRIGNNSKFIVTGDLDQHDRGYEQNGLKDFTERMILISKSNNNTSRIATVMFQPEHVERHPAVFDVLKIYHEADCITT